MPKLLWDKDPGWIWHISASLCCAGLPWKMGWQSSTSTSRPHPRQKDQVQQTRSSGGARAQEHLEENRVGKIAKYSAGVVVLPVVNGWCMAFLFLLFQLNKVCLSQHVPLSAWQWRWIVQNPNGPGQDGVWWIFPCFLSCTLPLQSF